MTAPELGLIAGGGDLPQKIAARCEAEGRELYVIRLAGFADPHMVRGPGGEFGMEGHLRVSFCGTAKEITEGVDRIRWALDPAAPNELYLGDRRLVRDWM